MKVLSGLALMVLCGAGYTQAQPAPDPAAVDSGTRIFQAWCVECHNARGLGTLYLQKRYQGAKPAILAQRDDLSSAFVAYIVRNGISFMPSFRKTEISSQELAALSAYLSSDPALRKQGR